MRLFSKQDGLPDLDEIIQKWVDRILNKGKKRLASANGGGEGGDDDGGDNKGRSLPPTSLLVLLFSSLAILLYLFVGFFTVDASERVVMFRLGNPIGVRGPGLKWHIPLIEDYRIVNVSEVQRVEVGYRNDTKNKNLRESLMLTGDLNIIDMQFVVQYALNDPELFLFENRFANQRAEDVSQQVAETSMREIVGRNGIDFILYEGRESIAAEAKSLMQNIMNYYETGIEIQQVAIQNVQPPDQVQDAFEDAIKARQDRERKINEGQAYANDILPRAQGQAARITKNAEAYRESSIVRAEGEADRFLLLAKQYAAAPEVTRRRLYLESMESIFENATKIIIDEDAGDGNLLYLPLDKLRQAGGVLAPRNSPQGNSSDSPPPTDTLAEYKNRLRDVVRSGVDTLEQKR